MYGPRLTGLRQLKSSFTFFRTAAQISVCPLLPGRSLMNNKTLPSAVNERRRSIPEVFIVGPKLTGIRHREFLDFRVETQMSSPPSEPVRFDVRNSVFSSFDITG